MQKAKTKSRTENKFKKNKEGETTLLDTSTGVETQNMETQIKTFKADGRMGIALNMKSKAQNNWEYKIKNPFTIKEEKKNTHTQTTRSLLRRQICGFTVT